MVFVSIIPMGARSWQYFERLRKRAPDAWIVGEKILEPASIYANLGDPGHLSYDFLNHCNGVWLVRGLDELQTIYTDFTGPPATLQRSSTTRRRRSQRRRSPAM